MRVITRNKDQGYASVHTLADLRWTAPPGPFTPRGIGDELSPKISLYWVHDNKQGQGIEPRGHREDHIYDVDYEAAQT